MAEELKEASSQFVTPVNQPTKVRQFTVIEVREPDFNLAVETLEACLRVADPDLPPGKAVRDALVNGHDYQMVEDNFFAQNPLDNSQSGAYQITPDEIRNIQLIGTDRLLSSPNGDAYGIVLASTAVGQPVSDTREEMIDFTVILKRKQGLLKEAA